MEITDFSQFGGINSIFSLIGMLAIYLLTEVFKWMRKKSIATLTKEQILISLKRLELLNLMQHSPEEKETIQNLFSEYKKLGGNCYVDAQYEKYLKEYILKINL